VAVRKARQRGDFIRSTYKSLQLYCVPYSGDDRKLLAVNNDSISGGSQIRVLPFSFFPFP
jgi:hypothetical protein